MSLNSDLVESCEIIIVLFDRFSSDCAWILLFLEFCFWEEEN